ncbi:hypothetical protein QYF36_024128 [Acer negundo]|nr:hypothetical protein QYF36_024128 [Acer negundo]
MHDGLGDTIRVSLAEPQEEEIDPCRRLANLGMRAADSQQGVAPFEEKHKHYFDFLLQSSQLPMQNEGEEVDYRGVLHCDGSVLMSISFDQLKVTTWQFTGVEWRDCNYMYSVTNLSTL